jgi:hypothetical protein
MFQRASICAALLLAVLGWASPGFAQSTSPVLLPNGCGTGNATGSLSYLTVDSTLKLCVNATVTANVGATAQATLPTVAPGSGAPLFESLSGGLYVQPIFGTTPVDATHGLPTNCVSGCAGGTASNATSGVATSSTNGQTLAWLYGFNGTTWDQLQVDASKSLKINCVTGCSAGGGGAVFGPTANGTAAANPPVLLGGTANGTGTGAVANLKVTAAGVASTDTSTVNGVTTLAGAGAVGTGAQRIAVGQDTTTVAGSAPGTAGTPSANVVSIQGVTSGTPVSTSLASGAQVAAFGPTPVGTAAANPPILQGGTANGGATGNVQVAKVDSNGSQFVDVNTTGNNLYTAINNPPNVGVNGTNTALTGATPGGSRTGTIVGMDVNISSVNQTAAAPVTLGPATDANSVPTTAAPSAATSAAATTAASSVLAASLSVSGAHNLYTFEVSADSTLSGAAWWVMVFDATTPPTGTVTPKKCYAVPSGTTVYSAAWPVAPIQFATGISIAVSTTGCFTATASTHAYFSADYK